MVKLEDIPVDASVTGTEEVLLNDSNVAKLATVNDVLAKQHDHTVSDITDYTTETQWMIDDSIVNSIVTKLNNCTVQTKNANYTFTGSEVNNTWFSTDTSLGNRTYTLNPALFPTTNGLFEFSFCKSTADTNTVTINVGSGNAIDSAQTYTLYDLRETVTIKIVSSTFCKVVATSNRSHPGLRKWLTASKMLVTDWTGAETYSDVPSVASELVWEAITAWDVLRMAVSIATWDSMSQTTSAADMYNFWYNASSDWCWQWITTVNGWLLTSIQMAFKKNWAPVNNVSCELWSWDGTTLLATSSNVINGASVTTTHALYTFNFSNVPLWPSTTYRFVLRASSLSITNYYIWWWIASNAYAWGSVRSYQWWTSWFENTAQDMRFALTLWAYTSETSWRLYKASTAFRWIIWFANNSASVWSSVTIDISHSNKLSWLTIWSDYYLSNTSGAISTTPWSVSVLVARAISATEIVALLK